MVFFSLLSYTTIFDAISAHLDCAFPSHRDRRMRLSVRPKVQNAPFRRVRLSSPAQT